MTNSTSWFSINAKADTEPVEISIFDQIGKDWFSGDGLAAKDFIAQLKTIPANREIVVAINSPGGNVWDGLAIYHQLKARGDKVTTRIDGIAASIASIIALAGSKVVMPKSALMMIHRAWGVAQGNTEDLTKLAAELQKHDDVLAGIYASKTGKTAEEMLSAMSEETWFTGDEAKAYGLADTVTDSQIQALSVDSTRFKNFPAAKVGTQIIQSQTRDDQAGTNAAALSVPLVAETDVQEKPAVTTAKKDPIMSETIAPVAADNAAVLAKLTALEAQLTTLNTKPAGIEPVAVARVENLGNPLLEKYASMTPGMDRNKFRIENHVELSKQRSIAIKNANTIDSALIPDYMSDTAITVLNNRLAMLNSFALGIGVSPLAPRQTVQVSLASAGSTTQVNATNFETGDSTLDGQPVTVDQYSQTFHVTNAQVNQGIMLSRLAGVNANALANKISDAVTALFVVGNYANTAVTVGADTAFTPTGGKLSLIYKAAKNFRLKNLLMDGGHLAYLIPTDKFAWGFGDNGAFGFDRISEHNRYTGATANSVGFVCAPEAVLIASGTPLNLPTSEFLSQSVIQLAGGLSVVASSWYSRASRNVWMSYDVMFGAGVGDATAGTRIISA